MSACDCGASAQLRLVFETAKTLASDYPELQHVVADMDAALGDLDSGMAVERFDGFVCYAVAFIGYDPRATESAEDGGTP
jgi:hypothetical protein